MRAALHQRPRHRTSAGFHQAPDLPRVSALTQPLSQTMPPPPLLSSGYGYPALVALNPAKAKYATLRSAFEEAAVASFMERVRNGREPVSDVAGQLAKVESRPPWDGADAAEEIEEEFSLEEIMGGKEEL